MIQSLIKVILFCLLLISCNEPVFRERKKSAQSALSKPTSGAASQTWHCLHCDGYNKYTYYYCEHCGIKRHVGGSSNIPQVGTNSAWFCLYCDHFNTRNHYLCEICGQDRPTKPSSSPTQVGTNSTWFCLYCDHFNTRNHYLCEICGQDRPTEPSSRSTQPDRPPASQFSQILERYYEARLGPNWREVLAALYQEARRARASTTPASNSGVQEPEPSTRDDWEYKELPPDPTTGEVPPKADGQECPICMETVLQPNNAVRCSKKCKQLFCKGCYDKILASPNLQKTCPMCRGVYLAR